MKKPGDRESLNWIYGQTDGYRWKLVLLVLCDAVISVLSVAFAFLSKGFLDTVLSGSSSAAYAAAVMLTVVLLQVGMRIGSGMLTEHIYGRLNVKIRNGLFGDILRKEYASVSGYHTGELLNRLFSDVQVVSDGVVSVVPNAVSMLTRLLAAFAALAVFDIRFVAVFAAAGIAVFGVTRVLRAAIKRLHREMQEANGKVRSFLQESIDRLLIIKIFGGGDRMLARSEALCTDAYRRQMKRSFLGTVTGSGFMMIFKLAYLGVMIYCALLMRGRDSAMTVGTMTAMLQLISQVQQPFAGLSGIMPKYYATLASAERLIEISRMPEEKTPDACIAAKEAFHSSTGIVINDLSLDYGRGAVLKNASAFIEKDRFTLISGTTGSGKSTLFMLMLGIYKGEGEIALSNGRPLDASTRCLFSYVPQGNLLFSGTVRDNMSFTKEVSDAEIERALRLSCAYDFVAAMPQGIDTEIGERGCAVSEGQAQRLAIARALISEAPVLLLDEATSALDEETERQLLANIKGLKNKTVLLISHKAAARDACDRELTVKNGVIL